jgi:ABC-type nitrate/sulfonate/bicarbonate transport system permease component
MNHRGFRRTLWASWLGFISILVVWQFVASVGIRDPLVFPGPAAVAEAAVKNVPLTRILEHIGISLLRVIMGFSLGAVVGITIGIVSGWYQKLGNVLRTPIEILRPIPPLAWIPLAIIWLGLGESSKVFIIFLGAFFPIFTNTFQGMITIDPNIVRAAQTLGVHKNRLLFKVIFPATLPDIATGFRVGWSYSFGLVVAAELIAASRGLGYMIMHARELSMISVIMYGIILIGAINLITDYLIQEVFLKRRLKWHYIETAF